MKSSWLTQKLATAATRTHKHSTAAKQSTELVNSYTKNKKKNPSATLTSLIQLWSSSNYSSQELSTVKRENWQQRQQAPTKFQQSAPQAPSGIPRLFYVQICSWTLQVFFHVLQGHFSTYISYQVTSSICPVIQVHFSTYKFLPEHIKHLPYPSSPFFYVRFLPEHIKYLPYPLCPFSTYNSYQNRSSICSILQVLFLRRSTKSSTGPYQVFSPVLQVQFSMYTFYRTHQVFCPLLQVHFYV